MAAAIEAQDAGGAGRIVGAGLGLVVVLALVAQLARTALVAAPGEAEILAERLELDPLPFGLEFQAGYRSGRELVGLYFDPQRAPEAERAEEADGDDARGEGDRKRRSRGDREDAEEYDWSAIEIGPPGTAPVELYLTRYGPGSLDRIEDLFAPPRESRGDEVELLTIDADGGTVGMDRGRVRWGAYEVVFVHNRTLERGGTFVDWMLVNLSLPGRPLVARVRWPRGYPGSTERLVELLTALRPTA